MQSLSGRKILIVEDEYLVAMALADVLEEAGAGVVGPIGRVDEALAYVASEGAFLDAAVLDVMLHGQVSYPVADALAARGIRFVFATGYGPRALDAAYGGYPRCEKPFRSEAILAALADAVLRN